jgi:hypothetical protein
MRFIGPEEGGVIAVSRTPGLVLIGVFATVVFQSDATYPYKDAGEVAYGCGKSDYSGT